jgi:hypothetical protein
MAEVSACGTLLQMKDVRRMAWSVTLTKRGRGEINE